uniref:Uncharacterized protein n=1 Tax=Amphora coffeiformis TaxID=265554 RepID=A0A7S3L2W5_9STRA
MADVAEIDYSAIDQEDGLDAEGISHKYPPSRANDSSTFEVDLDGGNYAFVPEEYQGYGWFDQRMATLKNGIDLKAKTFYRTIPRPFDKSVNDVPEDHPLRAIAAVFDQAPPMSVIRIKGYRITDFFAFDLIFHYATSHHVRIIIDYVDKDPKTLYGTKNTVSAISKFLDVYKRYQSYQLFNAIEIRVADTMDTSGGKCCPHGLSSMHEKAILTTQHSIYGSYNLTGYARCKNWESIRVSSAEKGEHEAFDMDWNQLSDDREISVVYSNFFPEDSPKRRRVEERDTVVGK